MPYWKFNVGPPVRETTRNKQLLFVPGQSNFKSVEDEAVS